MAAAYEPSRGVGRGVQFTTAIREVDLLLIRGRDNSDPNAVDPREGDTGVKISSASGSLWPAQDEGCLRWTGSGITEEESGTSRWMDLFRCQLESDPVG